MRINKLSKAIFCLLMLVSALPLSAQRYQNRQHDTYNDGNSSKSDSSDNIFKDNKKFDPRRMVYGGNFGASFSSDYTFVDLSPLVGYRFTDRFQAGVGGTYLYSRVVYYYANPQTGAIEAFPLSSSIYGARMYGEYDIFKDLLSGNDRLFGHAEVEGLNVSYYPNGDPYAPTQRTWIGNYFVGGGYRQALGRRSFVNITVLYNLNYNVNRDISPYSSPWVFRIGFML